MYGALALVILLPAATMHAQGAAAIAITVEDSGGRAVGGAAVTDGSGRPLGSTDGFGRLTVSCARPCRIHIAARGFAAQTIALSGAATVRLEPAANAEQITVTAYRAPLGELESRRRRARCPNKRCARRGNYAGRRAAANFQGLSFSGARARWWRIPHRRESACAGWDRHRRAARW